MAVKIDLKSGSTWVRDKNGDRATRIAHITGVTGTPDALLKAALDDPAMPQYGDHIDPADDSSITVQSIIVSALSGDVYQARIEYYHDPGSVSGSSNATVQCNAATTVEETALDINGAAMETVYTVAEQLLWQYSIVKPAFSAEVERPRVTYDFEYTDTAFPKTLIDTYLGKVNSVIWNSYAINTVLCTAINVSQQGDNYRIRFSFAYNENTWKFIASIPDAVDNIASSTDVDLNLTTGTKEFDVYDEVDFSPLGFTL